MKIPQWRTYLVITFVATMVAILAPESGTWLGVGHSGATSPGSTKATPEPTQASNGAKQEAFDYFPSHYRNEAQQPAAPVDTF